MKILWETYDNSYNKSNYLIAGFLIHLMSNISCIFTHEFLPILRKLEFIKNELVFASLHHDDHTVEEDAN